MKLIKQISVSAMAMVFAMPSFAADNFDVIRITYNEGLIDYINAEDINKISFTKGVDTESNAVAKVNDMFDLMKALWVISPAQSSHCDFSYPSLMIGLDAHTPYSTANYSGGYDWFSSYALFNNTSAPFINYPNCRMWIYCYKYIAAANETIGQLPDPQTNEERLLAAQAYALRSFAYWNLVQTFAHNYHYAPYAPAVPIVPVGSNPFGDESTATFECATTAEVYNQILSDIKTAISYLEGNPLTPAHIDAKHSRRFIDLGAAYGLYARYHLTMHSYNDAARLARLAIENTAATPLLREIAGRPGFNNAKLNNWMWGITIEDDDLTRTSGIVNFSSFVSSLSDGGYASVGAFRACSESIHRYLEDNPGDVRGNWFANDRYYNNLLTNSQNIHLNTYRGNEVHYPNLKFAPYRNNLRQHPIAADVPLMRVEEMYLIEAEAMAMAGNLQGGIEKLNAFIAEYRNPNYRFSDSSAEGLQEEIIHQRSIELWGEGLSYFDMLRLQLPLDTTNDNNFIAMYRLKFEGGSEAFKYKYPKCAPYVRGWNYAGDEEDSAGKNAPAKHKALKLK